MHQLTDHHCERLCGSAGNWMKKFSMYYWLGRLYLDSCMFTICFNMHVGEKIILCNYAGGTNSQAAKGIHWAIQMAK